MITPVLLGSVLLIGFLGGCSDQEGSAPSVIAPFLTTAAQSKVAPPKDSQIPRVIATFPANGAEDVDPALDEIWVAFSKEMDDQTWSWAYRDASKIPEMPADPYFIEGNTKNVLPVKLEPNKEYELWINTEKYNYFKDKDGRPVLPYEFRFMTRGDSQKTD